MAHTEAPMNEDICTSCGKSGNSNPLLHLERCGHWPTLPEDQYETAAEDGLQLPVASVAEMVGHDLLLLEEG